MKKLLLSIITIIFVISLGACMENSSISVTATPPETAAEPVSQGVILSGDAIPTQAPTQPESPITSPSFVPDTDIPDVVNSTAETANSNYTLYEDSSYIYYLDDKDESQSNLTSINKADGSVKQITSNDCICFSVNKGTVYYAELSKPENGNFNTIKSYNPATGEVKLVRKFKYDVYSMACYNGKLYFAYDPGKTVEPYSDLYVMNIDGTGMGKIEYDVYTFCIYKGVVYYTESSSNDGAPLDKCNLDGSGWKQIADCADWYIDSCRDYLLYSDGGGAEIQNIKTGIKTTMPESNDNTIAGQYFFYTIKGDNDTCLFGYDVDTQKTYSIIDLLGKKYILYRSGQNLMISKIDGNTVSFYNLIISDGKAFIEKAIE